MLTKILAWAISLSLCLVAAALGTAGFVWTRISGSLPASLATTQTLDTTDAAQASRIVLPRDLELGFRPVPLVHYVKRDPHGTVTEIVNDERGFRVDAPGGASAQRPVILAVGCSQTWGHAIANRDTYVSVAGRALGVQVANAAMYSYGTVQSVLMAERHLDLKPNVVLYGFFTDHLFRNFDQNASRPWMDGGPGRWTIKPPFGLEVHPAFRLPAEALIRFYSILGVPAELARGPIEAEVRQIYRIAGRRLGLELPAGIPIGRPELDELPVLIDAAGFLLDRLLDQTARIGARLAVVWLPQPHPPSIPFPPELRTRIESRGGDRDRHIPFVCKLLRNSEAC